MDPPFLARYKISIKVMGVHFIAYFGPPRSPARTMMPQADIEGKSAQHIYSNRNTTSLLICEGWVPCKKTKKPGFIDHIFLIVLGVISFLITGMPRKSVNNEGLKAVFSCICECHAHSSRSSIRLRSASISCCNSSALGNVSRYREAKTC